MDFSYNYLEDIDETIKLVPNVKILNLSHNKICYISDLSSLTCLSHLYIAGNFIKECDNLHTKLGKIVYIDISQNNISSLTGFRKLYSLETFNVSCNNITKIDDVTYIGNLPCLENLILTGNKVATIVDYRSKVFQCFGSRANDICLDNEKPSQVELDKAAVFNALSIVRDGKTPML